MRPAPESLWLDALVEVRDRRPALERSSSVDVAIVGAGYTGLWTAHALLEADPSLRVALVEAEFAGYGASGRNGGWCVGALAGLDEWIEDPATQAGALALQRALHETVDEVGAVAEREAIDCHFAKGGTLHVATNAAQERRLRADLAFYRECGFGEDDYRWLEPEEASKRVRIRGGRGGLYSPHCAALQPARLARGLARAVAARGAKIYENTPALALGPGRVRTPGGELTADVVVRATEAYTARLPGERRAVLPLHSCMIATEPLPPGTWASLGLAARETFADARRVVVYGQRTADGRIAFGARGGYFPGSRVPDELPAALYRQVHAILLELLPELAGAAITHRWGGPLAIPRDWHPSVGFDREAGVAWAGGYVGEGVAASNLAGRTLADLILARDTELVRLPWVGHRSPRWEPEPLRWLAVTGLRRAADAVDQADAQGREPSAWQSALVRWLFD